MGFHSWVQIDVELRTPVGRRLLPFCQNNFLIKKRKIKISAFSSLHSSPVPLSLPRLSHLFRAVGGGASSAVLRGGIGTRISGSKRNWEAVDRPWNPMRGVGSQQPRRSATRARCSRVTSTRPEIQIFAAGEAWCSWIYDRCAVGRSYS